MIKLAIGTYKMSAKLGLENKFYIDFQTISVWQWLNKPKMAYSRDAFTRK